MRIIVLLISVWLIALSSWLPASAASSAMLAAPPAAMHGMDVTNDCPGCPDTDAGDCLAGGMFCTTGHSCSPLAPQAVRLPEFSLIARSDVLARVATMPPPQRPLAPEPPPPRL